MDKDVIHGWTFKDQVSLWDSNRGSILRLCCKLLCCAASFSPVRTRRLGRDTANWWQRPRPIPHPVRLQWRTKCFQQEFANSSCRKGQMLVEETGQMQCEQDSRWPWKTDGHPGLPCQTPGLKSKLNCLLFFFFFSPNRTGLGEREG